MKKRGANPQTDGPDVNSRLARIEELLSAALGLPPDLREPEPPSFEQTDYIAHGSDEHRQLLGLVEVKDEEEALVHGFNITHRSPETGKLYHLADEMTPFSTHPNPDKAARLALVGAVNVLDAGTPPVPERSPELWTPDVDEARRRGFF